MLALERGMTRVGGASSNGVEGRFWRGFRAGIQITKSEKGGQGVSGVGKG